MCRVIKYLLYKRKIKQRAKDDKELEQAYLKGGAVDELYI